MKFNINTNTLREALESAQVKGKYVKRSGLSSGSLEECVYLKAQDNVLEIWSGNSTFIVNVKLELEIEENGDYIGKSADMIAYLKKFGETVTLHKTEHLTMSSGTKKASLPRIIEWPAMDAITRMGPKSQISILRLWSQSLTNLFPRQFQCANWLVVAFIALM